MLCKLVVVGNLRHLVSFLQSIACIQLSVWVLRWLYLEVCAKHSRVILCKKSHASLFPKGQWDLLASEHFH